MSDFRGRKTGIRPRLAPPAFLTCWQGLAWDLAETGFKRAILKGPSGLLLGLSRHLIKNSSQKVCSGARKRKRPPNLLKTFSR